MEDRSRRTKNHIIKFGYLPVGEEFRIPFDPHLYLKIEYHEYDLDYYEINAVNLDSNRLEFIEEGRNVRTSLHLSDPDGRGYSVEYHDKDGKQVGEKEWVN